MSADVVRRRYLLKADEELWEKELDPTVEKLLQTSRGYANSTKLDAMQADTRDKTRVVTFRSRSSSSFFFCLLCKTKNSV